ncbi:condensation domain-containing protein [Paracoccus sp. (in: a-proteobacteria)]|uniref:condensation domain-containing protein n=1 Tax=Paracoccus sp. TaxID=267 RepID=UPI0035B2EE28
MSDQSPDTHWLPLTLAQLDFWEEFRLHPDTPVSTVAHAIELRGPCDTGALAGAIAETIAETDVMALGLAVDPDGQPRQRIDPARAPALRRIDLCGRTDGRDHAFALMQADMEARLDLLTQPIFAQWLIRLAEDHHIWLNRGHHIAVDGYGMGLIERRCAAHYAARLTGGDAGPRLGAFGDYLNEETDYRAGPRHAADGGHWAQILAHAPPPRILRKGSENYPTEALFAEHDLSPLRAALMARATALGMGWPDLLTVLCAIWVALRVTGPAAARRTDPQGRIAATLWLPYMSRMGSVSITVPALVVNILPLGVDLSPDEGLGAVLSRLSTALRKLRRHGRYRIEQIAQDYGVPSGGRFFFSPLINVLPFDAAHFPGCEMTRHVLSNGPGDGFNITIRGDGEAEGLELLTEADPALTPAAGFAALADSLPEFLRAALAADAATRPVKALPGLGR